MITPVADKDKHVHYELKFDRDEDKEGRIQRMCFSYDGNLYVLVYTNDHEIMYKLPIKRDFHKVS